MAPQHFSIFSTFLVVFHLISSCFAATVNYDWNITWVTRNPDALYERTTIGINNQWPVPEVRCNVGDRLVVNVNNQLGNQSVTIHWHGLYQNGTGQMDGVPYTTQCPIPAGSSMVYNFTVDQPGTVCNFEI